MSRFLQSLVGLEEPAFTIGLRRLESSTGSSGIDTRLIADITQKAHEVMRVLGLDTNDSTALEVYGALNRLAQQEKAQNVLLGADYVLMQFEGQVVSFNLIDIIDNTHHELGFEERIISHGQRSLRGEIVKRYIQANRSDESSIRSIAAESGLLPESEEGYSRANNEPDLGAPYILAVGDIFTDVFIELDPQEANVFEDENGQARLSIPFGSKPPYLSAESISSVGPSPNAAVSFARLGLRASLRAFLGDDATANRSIAYLKKEGVDTNLVELNHGMKSNCYYVLRLESDRTILVKNEDYQYSWKDPLKTPDWVYLSLLSKNSWKLHEDLLAYLKKNPQVKLAFQPGTFHFEWGTEKLKGIYARSYIVVMNKEEAVEVTGGSADSIGGLCQSLHELGPEVVVITDGPNGSYASFGGKVVRIENFPDPAPPVDRTGAGDAFASTIVAALATGETMETALTWAPINSMNVVQKLGAQAGLLGKEEIIRLLSQAPESYRAKEYKA